MINEILANSYIDVHYVTATINKAHRQRWFFDAVPVDTGGGVFAFPTYVDAGHPTGWSIAQIVQEIHKRASLATSLLPDYTIASVEVYASAEGDNIFMGYDAGDYDPLEGGGATINPAAYFCPVWATADKSIFKVFFFDTQSASPQRVEIAQPPAIDDTYLHWFILKSAVKFVNQDNKRLLLVRSQNTGYNKKLARIYGKSILP